MENTIENKQKFFSLYWDQEVFKHPENTECYCVDFDALISEREEFHLLLTPLSSITDEDATDIATIVTSWDIHSPLPPEDVYEWLDEVLFNNSNTCADYVSGFEMLEIIDYLRSRGYAMPYMGISVETLAEYGWIKLKTP